MLAAAVVLAAAFPVASQSFPPARGPLPLLRRRMFVPSATVGAPLRAGPASAAAPGLRRGAEPVAFVSEPVVTLLAATGEAPAMKDGSIFIAIFGGLVAIRRRLKQ